MKKLILIFPICLVLACAFSGCSKAKEKKTNILEKPQETRVTDTNAPDAPIDFKLKWNPGLRYTFRLELIVGVDVPLPNTNQPQKYVVALGHTYSVVPAKLQPDGGQELDLEMTAQRTFMQISERNFLAFDSRQSAEQDAADPVSPLLRKLLNVPVKAFLDAEGKLARTEGLDVLSANLNEGYVSVRNIAQKIYTEQNLSKVFALIAASQPADAKKIGQTWPLQSGVTGTSNVVLNANFKAASWDEQDNRECVRIDFQGDVSVKSDAANAVPIEGGNFSGNTWFDPELGTILNSSVVGHLTAKNSSGLQPIRINFSYNIRLLSLEEK